MVNDPSLDCSFSHEEFVLLAPQRRHCKNPPNFSGYNLSNLFLEPVQSLRGDEFKSLLDHQDEGKLSPIKSLGVVMHVKKMDLVLRQPETTF